MSRFQWKTELSVDGEVQLTDALTKLDEVYGVLFEGKTYNIATCFDWICSSSNSALKTVKRDEIIKYMKTFIG